MIVVGLEAMKRAADLAPTDPEVLDYYARALNRIRRLDEAASVYRRAIELDPNRPSLWAGYAVVSSHLGKSDQAEKCAMKALEIDPGCSWAVFFMQTQLVLTGRVPAAVSMIKKAINTNPNSAQLWMSYSVLLSYTRDPHGADVAVQEALSKVETSHPDEQRRALSGMMLTPHSDKAIEIARSIIKNDPDNLGIYGPMINWCIENDLEEGKRLVEHAFRIDPNNSSLKPEAAKLLMKSGDYKGAKKIIESIRREMPNSPIADTLDLFISKHYEPKDEVEGLINSLEMYIDVQKAKESLQKEFTILQKDNRDEFEWDVTREAARRTIDDVRGLYSTTIWHIYYDMISKVGWTAIRDRMISTLSESEGHELFSARIGILDSLNMVELAGFDGDLSEVLLSIPDTGDLKLMSDNLYEILVDKILEQIEGGGPTLFLDTERLAQTSGARLIPCILEKRREEINGIEVRVVDERVDLRQLWLTSYGYDILSGLKIGLEIDLQGLKKVQSIFKDAGMSIATKKHSNMFSDEEIAKVSESLRSFVFNHAQSFDKEKNEGNEGIEKSTSL